MVPEHAEDRLCTLLGLSGDARRDVMAATRRKAFPRGGESRRGGRGAAPSLRSQP